MKGNNNKRRKDRMEINQFKLSRDLNPTQFKYAVSSTPRPFKVNILELALATAIAQNNRKSIHACVQFARLAGVI